MSMKSKLKAIAVSDLRKRQLNQGQRTQQYHRAPYYYNTNNNLQHEKYHICKNNVRVQEKSIIKKSRKNKPQTLQEISTHCNLVIKTGG